MPLYRRAGSPFWWYSFTLDGARFRGSTGKSEKREAAAVEHDALATAKASKAKPGNFRLRDALGAYWTGRGQHCASAETIFHQLEMLSDGLGRDTRVAKLTNAMLMDYRARRRGHGLQQHSINREIVILRAALTYARKIHGEAHPDFEWSALRTPEPPGRIRFLSRDEYSAIMAVAHPTLRPIILCAVTTGLREGNILDLDWSDVNLSGGWITVLVKGNKRHAVRVTAPLRASLAMTPPERRKGRVYDRTNFRKRWIAAVKAAGLADVRFHDLRHTFASWARQAGADIADICEALGHSDVSMTMRYAHIKPDEHETAFDRVAATFLSHSEAQRHAK